MTVTSDRVGWFYMTEISDRVGFLFLFHPRTIIRGIYYVVKILIHGTF